MTQMRGVQRFTMHYDYMGDGADSCCCDVEEDTDGLYVEYSSYMSLLCEYSEFQQEVMNERKKN